LDVKTLTSSLTSGRLSRFVISGPLSFRRLSALDIILSLAAGALEQLLTGRHCVAYRLFELPFIFLVLAKKLFANEEQSYTESVPLDVLVVPLAGAYLFAILHGIAA